ncbi:uncharacterized protein N7506_004666 [Penicillium brevicompactum]|uniref:uncharacterized protein n=1 Tax=Penicillium brevicompactum TaxID=5074 RepID=UPI0025420E57|nr:uncharacterized protein N7506_004666 [Penicillium brevicompactum]KAJ5336644.1 hypothetical protein N7506_004666 [Penicillium brevicompactum]
MATYPRRNVRNDLLPTDRQVAPKDQLLRIADCRVCQKRRIRCDRTVPQCQKCGVRGFTCPGFPSIVLRWDQGIASRGKFTGRKLPLLDNDKSTNPATSRVNRQIREGTLHTLTQKMQAHMLGASLPYASNASAFSIVETLASMLALCYSEILIPNSKEWGLHLQACRIIIERHSLQTDAAQKQSSYIHFLVKEVSDLLACGNFSIFSRHAEYSTAPYRSNIPDNQYWGFLNLIDEITVAERSRYGILFRNENLSPMDMSYWHVKLDKAYGKATQMLTSLAPPGKCRRKYSSAIVKAHYYAVSIYCFQSFEHCGDSNIESRKPSIESLVETIACAAMEPCSAFAHDLFFPLFIAGTECRTDKLKQQIIEEFFEQSISACGFWCNDAARRFLRAFWKSSDERGTMNWISFARKNEHEIGSFVVF